MELGNMLFGHSRGEAVFEREMSTVFQPLWDLIDYHEPFENDVFAISPYWWGDCRCEKTHVPNCRALVPNFLFKPDGFKIQWYKFPFRDSYASREIDVFQCARMVEACVKSIEKKPE